MRRTVMAMLVVAVWATAGASWAQTTTTSTTATTSTTSTTTSTTTTSTSTSSTTATTLVVPRLPTATLSGVSGQVPGELSSNCWPVPTGGTVCGHYDYVGPGPNPPTLAVTQGESLTLRFDPPLAVATLSASFWPAGPGSQTPVPLDVPASDPSSFRATMGPGTYLISLNVTFSAVPAGYVSYFFQIRVTAPATTVRPAQPVPAGRVALTG